MPRRKEPRIPDAVLDQLLAGADPKTNFVPNGLSDDLKKALAERVLDAEMDHHLSGEGPRNRRNGYGQETVITEPGQIELEVPRRREARFDPEGTNGNFVRSLGMNRAKEPAHAATQSTSFT